MKIIDAHSHIDYISHNLQDDVVGTVCCATNESQWKSLIDKSKSDTNLYCAMGVHPWFAESVNEGFENRLYKLLNKNKSFMVGEIGLDKYHPDMDKQIDIFIKQLDIAIELNRTVFLHCVGAWDKILHILKQYKKSELPIIVAHAFNANDNILNDLIKNYNVMFSFNKIDKPQEIHRIEQIKSDSILVETDGKRNVCLKEIVNKISLIKQDLNIPDVIYNNTKKVLENG